MDLAAKGHIANVQVKSLSLVTVLPLRVLRFAVRRGLVPNDNRILSRVLAGGAPQANAVILYESTEVSSLSILDKISRKSRR